MDLRNETVKSMTIPGTNRTNREFMLLFGRWMRDTMFNPYIFADIARRQCDRLLPHWPRFVFDDCRFPEEPAPFSLAYGSHECLIISIDRKGCSWSATDIGCSLLRLPGAAHIALSNNTTINDMLSTMESVLGTWGGGDRLPHPPITIGPSTASDDDL
jgi:hypothetical protein